MNTEAIYDAISGFDETYVSAAENIDAIRLSFQKYRTHKIKMIETVCACAAVVIATGWISLQGWFGKKPPASQNTLVPQVGTSVSDDQTTGQMQDRQTTAGERSTTAPSNEVGNQIPKTENTTQTVPTGTHNQQEGRTKAPQTDVPSTTKVKDTPTNPEDEAAFYLRYTYSIVGSAFSAYRPGKVVSEEMVGDRLEDAAATGLYIFSDGRTEEDETLRCEIFALKGIDTGIAVCVRFIDKGKGLTTDHYYLLYNPAADTSAIEAYLIPQTEANNEE